MSNSLSSNFSVLYSGVVLFPEATLPLRVVEANFIAAVERALNQVDAPYTVGVVGKLCKELVPWLFCLWNFIFYFRHVLIFWIIHQVRAHMNPDNGRIKFATVGTTAEVSHLIFVIYGECSNLLTRSSFFILQTCLEQCWLVRSLENTLHCQIM